VQAFQALEASCPTLASDAASDPPPDSSRLNASRAADPRALPSGNPPPRCE
jgi:hypothetical protein